VKKEIVMSKLLKFLAITSLTVSVFAASVRAQETDVTPTPSGLEGGVVGEVDVNTVTLVYETFGPDDGEPILFIAGTGMQLIEWPVELIDALVEQGYRVIVFDNRDVGLSTKLDEAGPPDWAAIFNALGAGEPLPVAYTADDMAQDAIGLLDALDIEQAHLVGVSGGAIISQVLAADYPEYVLSLTLIAPNSGNPAYPIPANPEHMAAVPPVPPEGSPIEAFIEQKVVSWQTIASPAYPPDEKTLRDLATRVIERSNYPVGSDRQGAAVLAVLPAMGTTLETIQAPTVVIHGEADPLIPYQLGEDVANTIPGAEFMLVEGMGHDLPLALVPMIADAIIDVAEAAQD
jgi:pimeloyl-ACP methyl ester carboxylesterase